mmetsp:Transcript_29498/g.78014  ORF Transcript_29498/g.78014 Transcript_29498/m.78014 type:complete len:203 (-) Transcript_29498:3-611(-)
MDEKLLCLLHLIFCNFDPGIERLRWHLHEFFHQCPPLLVAEFEVSGATTGTQVVVCEELHILVGSRTLVNVEIYAPAPHECGVASDAMGFAYCLRVSSTVHFRHQRFLGAFEVSHQLVPVGFEFLAVTAPRRIELHEQGLPLHLLLPIVWRQLQSTAELTDRHKGEGNGAQTRHPSQGHSTCMSCPTRRTDRKREGKNKTPS